MSAQRLVSKGVVLAVLSLGIAVSHARGQYGAVLSGTGAVNRSMGGAATAAPLSACGALFWNPATMPGLGRSELEFGAELFFPRTQLSSSVAGGALGPGVPSMGLSGQQNSDSGAFPLPTIGLVFRPEDSPLTFGLGVFAFAGFGADYAGSNTNPITMAPPPNGIGFGPIHSDFEVLQIAPAVAYQVTDRLSISAGPTVNLAKLSISPAIFASPDDANGDGFFTYPQGTHSQTTWGGGIVLGAYYQEETWAVGASVKSPQWFDTFRFNSNDEIGRPRTLNFNLDLPLIASLGASYRGFERWMLAADVRYLDYNDANGLGDAGFLRTGAVNGVGWKSIFAAAAGAQYDLTDAVSLRLGYSWNGNPVPNGLSAINAATPVIIEHMLSAGASWRITQDFTLSLAYVHGFQNSGEGPLLTPAGAVPGTSVKNATSGDIVVLGGSVTFGGTERHKSSSVHSDP